MLYRMDKSQELMQRDGPQGKMQVNYSKEIGPMRMGEDKRVKANHKWSGAC